MPRLRGIYTLRPLVGDSGQTNAEAIVQTWSGRARRVGIHPPTRPIRAAAAEVRHLHQLERAGESEWTPWIAIVGLILFFVTIGLLIFGIVEGASHVLASAAWPPA